MAFISPQPKRLKLSYFSGLLCYLKQQNYMKKVKNDHRSKFSNLSNWKEEAWKKKSELQRDSNPWPPRCRCVPLPTELWSHTLGARSIYWVHISREEWNELFHILHIKIKWSCETQRGLWPINKIANWEFNTLSRMKLKVAEFFIVFPGVRGPPWRNLKFWIFRKKQSAMELFIYIFENSSPKGSF